MRKYDCYDEHNHAEQIDVGTCDHHHIERLQGEVEKLREVARLSKIIEQYGCEVGSQTWSELRDALAKRGEEGE